MPYCKEATPLLSSEPIDDSIFDFEAVPDVGACAVSYWCDRKTGTLFIGRPDEPRYSISHWKSGFHFMRFSEYDSRLIADDTCDPPLDIPLLAQNLEPDVDSFIDEIPLVFREIAEPFRSYRALILKLMRIRPEAAQIAKSNPALLLLVAGEIHRGNISLARVPNLIMSRRRDIAGVCGCRPTESAVRTLSRMNAANWPYDTLQALHSIIKDPAMMDALAHIPCISKDLIELLHRWPGSIECDFMRKDKEFIKLLYAQDSESFNIAELIGVRDDLMRMCEFLGVTDIEERIRRSGSIRSLKKLHNKYIKQLNRQILNEDARVRFNERFGLTIFPEPPLSGNSDIVPVLTARQLLEEGREMDNCVASYISRIENRECFIYRVFRPQRCTLSIVINRGKPAIEEIRGKGNSPAAPSTVAAVERWIREEVEMANRYAADKRLSGD